MIEGENFCSFENIDYNSMLSAILIAKSEGFNIYKKILSQIVCLKVRTFTPEWIWVKMKFVNVQSLHRDRFVNL